MNKKFVGTLSLLLIGVLFGLSGVIAKYLSSWLNPYQVVEYRFVVAFLIAILSTILFRQKLQFGKASKISLILFALTFPISVIFFTLAIFNTTVSLAVFSFYIANLVSSFLIGKLYFNESITKNKKIALILIILAIVTFTDPLNNLNIELGFVFGILSGIFQTVASAFQKIVGKSANRISLLLIQTAAGTIVSASTLLLTGNSLTTTVSSTTMIVIVFFGAIFLAISYLFLLGFKYIDLNVGSILVSTELFFGPFFAFLFLSEKLTSLEIIGGILIAFAVIVSNRKDSKKL